MKKFLIILFVNLFITNNLVFGQKLNDSGKQMIKTIRVYNGKKAFKYKFDFYYDKQCRLIKFTCNGNSTFGFEIWYENGTIHKMVKSWKDGAWSRNYKYEYSIDSNRHIIKKIMRCYADNGINKGIDYERWDYNFNYDYSTDSIKKIISFERNYVPIKVKDRIAIPQMNNIEKHLYKCSYNCGNQHIFNVGTRLQDGRSYELNSEVGKNEYSSYCNLTNINFNYILNENYLCTEYMECATEWCNCNSKNFLLEIIGRTFIYYFKNNDTLLYKVEKCYDTDNIESIFEIEYVEAN